MIVDNVGYIKIEQVIKMAEGKEPFSIYATKKKTIILVKNATELNIKLYKIKEDRLPWKITEGRKIISGTRLFNSVADNVEFLLQIDKWNNGTQIMSYEEVDYKAIMGG